MSDHLQWMQMAIEQARLAQSIGEVPVGAIIVHDGKIIGKGHNRVITNKDCSAHAEIQAIRNAGEKIKNYRLVNTQLYVTLEPCMMCVGAIVHARIESVIFGAYDNKTGVVMTKDTCFDKSYHNHKVKHIGGILELDCARLLKDFFKQKRAKSKN